MRVKPVDPLAPYVPNLVVDWLATEPDREHRTVPGTFVFADISGFTALTQRLGVRGKEGAEEMGELLNGVFDPLLTAAYHRGASLLKWGGDAVLLLFEGTEHLQRGVRAAWELQQVVRRVGRLRTSAGLVRLGMSIGVHTGQLEMLLVGTRHRELVVTGPGATTTVLMEQFAGRGEVVLSLDAAAGLPFSCRGETVGTGDAHGVLLARPPRAAAQPNRRVKRADVDLAQAMSPHVAAHLRGGVLEHEHRGVAVGFVELRGTDALLAGHGLPALTAAVRTVLDAVQDACDAHQVTLLATDVSADGVKVIVTSGAPRAAGDAETRVLSVVRRVVDLDVALTLRGGVACGFVFAGDYGPFYRRTYSVTGDVVNLAARLMGKAEPREVLTTPELLARSRTPFLAYPREPLLLKGMRLPVAALSVTAVLDAPAEAARERVSFVGRERELAVLREAAQLAAAGAGRVVEIVGPPGLGKSSLVQALLDELDTRVLRADGDIYGSATPYQPMQRMLRRALDLPPDVASDALVTALHGLVQAAAPHLLGYLPLLAVVAGVQVPSTPEVDVLDPQVRRDRLEQVTTELLALVLRRPVVMVLNDTQFMDEATISLLRRLAQQSRRQPWLLLVTRRPEGPRLAAGDEVSLTLPPLSSPEVERLVGLEGVGVTRHHQAELVRRAGGNPLYLRQLLSAMAGGADLDALPDTIEAIIAVQLDQLPAQQRRWVRAASVLGATVDTGLMAGLLPGEPGVEPGALPDLLLPGQEPGTLEFGHDLIRLTAYAGLAFRRRVSLHAQVADLLEQRGSTDDVALLSLHCLHGQRYDAAWRYSLLAGDAAARAYALLEARACYRRALEAAARLPDLGDLEFAELCERLARVCLDLGDAHEAERALRLGRRRVRGHHLPYARLALRTAWHRHALGRHADALRWVLRGRTALRDPRSTQDWKVLAELAELGGYVRYDLGDYVSARRWTVRAVQEAEQGGDRQVLARCRGTLAPLDALTGRPVDERTVRETLQLFDGVGDLPGKAAAANKLAMCLYFDGRWPEAVELYEVAESCYRRCGMEQVALLVSANLAEVLAQQGRYDEAAATVGPALTTWRAAQASSYLSFGLMIAGRAALGQERLEQAEALLVEARSLALAQGEVAEVLMIDGLLGQVWVRAGEPRRTLSRSDAALGGARGGAAVSTLLRVRGVALRELGQVEEGTAVLRQALAAARAGTSPDDLLGALEALCEAAAGEPEEQVGWAEERAALAARLGTRQVSVRA